MAVTETTRESWGSRLGASLKGIVIGAALFIVAFPILFWNEGDSVRTAKALEEGEGAYVAVESNGMVNPEMDGKLVHVTGKVETKDVLEDEEFGISVEGIRLERRVEMYQWVEDEETVEKKNVGGSVTKTTTYSYSKAWVERLVDSTQFHVQSEGGVSYENPAAFEFAGWKKSAADVKFGAFRFGEDMIAKVGGLKEYEIPASFTSKVARVKVQGNVIYVPNRATRLNEKNERDVVAEARIGDMRVMYKVVWPHEVSIVAKQQGDTFGAYTAKNGKSICMLVDGVKDGAAMFASAKKGNAMMTWGMRVVGFLMMFIGLSMVLKPLSVLADVLPFLGNLMEMGISFVAGLGAMICSLVTIAVAWIFYRPILGIGLLVVAAVLIWKLKQGKRGKSAAVEKM
jgi:hypothetical protein